MGSSISVQNDAHANCHVSIHTVGKGFEVRSFTVKVGEKIENKFPEAVWYDVKFIIGGYETWQIGVYGGSSKAFRVTYKDGTVYVNTV